jgi:biopolymer transport protein ExbD
MMKNFGGTTGGKTDINITSLIDVIFMLVVFFMIGTNFEKSALGVSLPKASSGVKQQGKFVTVTVDAEGVIYIDGEAADRESFIATLSRRHGEFPDLKVALECDTTASFGSAARAIDYIKLAGVSNVAIRHDPDE